MTRWKMVPTDLSLAAPSTRAIIREWLAAAPKWEPSDADVDRAWVARTVAMDDGLGWKESMRAAILAAMGGE